MIWLISWLIYGLIVGCIAKWAYRHIWAENETLIGAFPTLLTGVMGSYAGGFLNYLFCGTGSPFAPSGMAMGVIGAVIVLVIYGVAKKRAA